MMSCSGSSNSNYLKGIKFRGFWTNHAKISSREKSKSPLSAKLNSLFFAFEKMVIFQDNPTDSELVYKNNYLNIFTV